MSQVYILKEATYMELSVGSTQVPLLMCTLEIPQKIAAQVLALNLLLFALLLSFSLNGELIFYFVFAPSFNHMDLSIIQLNILELL